MYQLDRTAINDLVSLDNLTNSTVMTYISMVAMSKMDKETQYPIIENFTVHNLSKYMLDEMTFLSASGIRLGVKRLLDVGFIAYTDETEKNLVILNNGTGWIKSDKYFKSKGYITLHHFFFKRIFYDLPIAAKKLVLEICSRLNGEPLKPVKINFKSKKNPETYEKWCEKLKVNRPVHIRTILTLLKGVFNITILDHNTVKFSLNRVSKALIVGTDNFLNYTQDQLDKTTKIMEEENKKNLSFSEKDIKAICSATCSYTMKIRRETIKELCKNNRDNVKNLFGYTMKLTKRINSGLSYHQVETIYAPL